MELFNYLQYKHVFVCGDIHGDFYNLLVKIERYKLSHALVIVAGDCNLGFKDLHYYKNLYGAYRQTLEALDIYLIFVRGNHDDPAYFEHRLIDFKHMFCVPDYSVINTAKHSILCIGGSISLDRNIRLEAMRRHQDKALYWPDEGIVYKEDFIEDLHKNGLNIDTLITHDCPDYVFPSLPFHIDTALLTDAILNDAARQRALLNKIYDDLILHGHKLKHWFYGHYHASHSNTLADTSFIMLNIMELKEL